MKDIQIFTCDNVLYVSTIYHFFPKNAQIVLKVIFFRILSKKITAYVLFFRGITLSYELYEILSDIFIYV